MKKSVSVRLAAEGGKALSNELVEIGREGKQALSGLAAGARPASEGLTDVSSAATGALAKLEEITARSARAAAALRATAPAASEVQERINRMTGVTPAIGQATSAFIEQGRELDALRARYNPVFGVLRTYRMTLSDIRDAHLQGAISNEEMTAAIQRERQATLASIAVLKGRTTAINAMGAATGMARFRTQQLFYQINDIGVSLVSGMNPFVVLAQQGTQVAQIYGGQGGVGQALKDTRGLIGGVAGSVLNLARAHPVLTAAIAATSLGLAGMTHEINQAQDVHVSLGDTALAIYQIIRDGLWDWVKPAVEMLAPWFSTAWDWVKSISKTAINAVINGVRIGVDAIGTAVDAIPAAFELGFEGAKAAVFYAVSDMVKVTAKALDGIAGMLNDTFGTEFGTNSGAWDIAAGLDQRGSDAAVIAQRAATQVGDALSGLSERASEIWNSDPLGEFFDDVKIRAVNNALDETEDAAKRAGAAGKQAGKDISEIGKEKNVDHLKKGVEGVSEALARVAVYGGSLREKLQSVFQGIAFDILNSGIRESLSSVFSGVGGGGGGGGGFFKRILSSIFHTGGVVGAGGATRSVPLAAFAGAQRFHDGGWPGLKSNEVPAILQRGERVLSRQEVASGAGSGGMVEVMISVDGDGSIVPVIQRVTGPVIARTVGAELGNYDRQVLPIRVAEISANPRNVG